jgi:hypothetical protein
MVIFEICSRPLKYMFLGFKNRMSWPGSPADWHTAQVADIKEKMAKKAAEVAAAQQAK